MSILTILYKQEHLEINPRSPCKYCRSPRIEHDTDSKCLFDVTTYEGTDYYPLLEVAYVLDSGPPVKWLTSYIPFKFRASSGTSPEVLHITALGVYSDNSSPAIGAKTLSGLVYAKLTYFDPDITLGEGEYLIKTWSENQAIYEQLLDLGILRLVRTVPAGYSIGAVCNIVPSLSLPPKGLSSLFQP